MGEKGALIRTQGNVLASLEYFGESYKIALELRFNRENRNSEKVALAFWRQLLENVRTQVEGFCSGVSWNEFVPCVHCLRSGVFRDRVYLFDYQKVIDAFDTPFMYCNHIESSSRCVARIEVAPDISLRDLPQVATSRLRVGEQIGEGGFGVVYKGTLDQQVVAVKELSSSSLDADLFREFQAEAFIQSLLNHPNCVRLFGLTAAPPRMVLEFVSGGDLCRLIHPKKGPKPTLQTLPWQRRFEIAFDIAKGLHHLQTRSPPVIHRDIRSPNIFMTAEGRALLGDFGLARQVNPEVGGMLGTWQWLAPECIDSLEWGAYDHRTDLYSFGMVLWEIVTCDVPFEEFAEDPRYSANGKLKLQDIKRAIIVDHLRPTLPTDIPSVIRSLILRCWSADVDTRPSCQEILQQVGAACNHTQEAAQEITRNSNGATPAMDSSRLSSHLVTFTAPTIRPEQPLHAITLDRNRGKPRVLATAGDQIWAGTNKGYILIFVRDENNHIQIKDQWQAHHGRLADLACADGFVWSCSDDNGSLNVWDISRLSMEASLDPFHPPSRGCGPSKLLVVHGRVWVASSQQGKILVYNSATRELETTFQNDELVGLSDMALHKDHVWIGNAGKIILYDWQVCESIGSFQAHECGRMATLICPVGDAVWTACSHDIRVWDAPTLEMMSLTQEMSVSDAKLLCLSYCSSTGRVFSGSFNGELVMWNSRTANAMQEMVPTDHTVSDLKICDDIVWCVTALYEVFIFSANQLHTKPRPAKMNEVAEPLLRTNPSDRAKRRGPDPNAPGRSKAKGVTLRRESDQSGLSQEEVSKRLARGGMLTLRRKQAPNDNSAVTLRLLTPDNKELPCNLRADSRTKVATLLQTLIPDGLTQLNIYQPGLSFEVLYNKAGSNLPSRFVPSDLAQPLLQYGRQFVLNRIPTQQLQQILQSHHIEVYFFLSKPNPRPTGQIQIFSG